MISLFAAELEKPKIGISGKQCNGLLLGMGTSNRLIEYSIERPIIE